MVPPKKVIVVLSTTRDVEYFLWSDLAGLKRVAWLQGGDSATKELLLWLELAVVCGLGQQTINNLPL